MSAATTYVWQPASSTGLLEADGRDLLSTPIRVADSWLVDTGRVRALELHRRRFLDAVGTLDTASELNADAFWDAAIAALPRSGRWFPRVELVGKELRVLLRPAPEPSRSLTVLTHTGTDPRSTPHIKGPDLGSLARIRQDARTRGADEAVLLTAEGNIAEGTTTCLAWWNGDALGLPSADTARIDSVTLRSLQAIALALGIRIEADGAKPDDLEGHEVWALNALYGIRIVTTWLGGPATAEEPGRLARWQARLDALRTPLL